MPVVKQVRYTVTTIGTRSIILLLYLWWYFVKYVTGHIIFISTLSLLLLAMFSLVNSSALKCGSIV